MRRREPAGRRALARRGSVVAGCALLVAPFISACGQPAGDNTSQQTTLRARPAAVETAWPDGTRRLNLSGPRDALLYLPSNPGNGPVPLLLLLHGAGGSGEDLLAHIQPMADSAQVAVVAPDSRGSTWDAVTPQYRTLLDILTSTPRSSGFGPDLAFIDQVLAEVFQHVAVDRRRVSIGGFSDGATYALSLGSMNGDLFTRIVAFSPGFVLDGPARGRPAVFITHGRGDTILPIDRSSRRIVPALRGRGYDVVYREFDGGHAVPDVLAGEAFRWAAAPP